MELEKIKRAEQLLKALQGYGALSQEQLTAFIQEIANVFAQYRSATQTINKETKDTLNLIVKQVNAEHDRILEEVKNETTTTQQNLTKELKLALDEVNSLKEEILALEPKNGENGLDADEEKVTQMVLEKLPKPTDPETGESIVDKINALNTEPENQIDAKHIKNLPKFIDRVIGGGVRLLANLLDVSITDPQNGEVLTYDSSLDRWKNGTNSGSMATHYAETPNEAINGSRTAFTVDHSITFIIGIYLNGQFIHPDQYSYTGTTITFNSALPEEFASSSFTVVYY